ncbi:hypothetical protein E2C01_049871 [Portunus trituberculatus]|uniref:Uncharacterized protein n=1 Tax=Portunus trituberculatus TaxID=210409 RepID=A0A5B7GEY8_PORTR|nr:hypothetical protein [Portunus trituberculatus]
MAIPPSPSPPQPITITQLDAIPSTKTHRYHRQLPSFQHESQTPESHLSPARDLHHLLMGHRQGSPSPARPSIPVTPAGT